ncbi:hypothetical protein NSB25_12485 [Acetatifactor muris]|uniref:Uncharacterized protein n=1 Tax=Acetatifactor muris TaxID=879566 RepID=A0A2K4ZH76_9FIRM|nr:hypothetical protein [Acetatifactor muris]MCR2048105.1 hypothetical protein [Acetatifactor muris]SOY29817.1 hypothetical protein AMURIS_02538 [Acetatifactor muris]
MRKTIIKLSVFFLVFVLSLIIVSKIRNRGHDNLTMEMAPSTLPMVTMVTNGVEYNRLHGYCTDTDVAFQREHVTVLGEARDTGFVVDTCGRNVSGISIEVRSEDGSRLIESTQIKEFQVNDGRISGTIALKDLIERDMQYSLTILLDLDGASRVSYYTKVIWSDALYLTEKLDYVLDFHERLYDREAARELAKYLETNSKLESNASFHKVNIHSSFRQITWGELNVTEVQAPSIRLAEIATQTASLLLDYIVATEEGRSRTYYTVTEYYRIRYTSDRIYLLDYERTMTQIPETDHMFANDKILLGITGTDVPMMESEDGNVVVFQAAGRLFGYNLTTNKLTVIFGFYDEDNADARTMYNQHSIKILDVDEGGNVQFAVYGYMNRGRHEGEVGVQIYTHNSAQNTIEELLYIPYDKSYAVLDAEMKRLLYLNREQKLYLMLNNAVYGIDLAGRTYSRLLETAQDEGLQVSEDHKIAVWPVGEDIYHSTSLEIRNFGNDTRNTVSVQEGEVIRPLGFMEEDIIYGVARADDIVVENSGRIFYPMYKVCICNSAGELLKEYRQQDVYVTECTVTDNQITLERVRRLETGAYQETEQEHITNNLEAEKGKNMIVTADTEKYQRYVEIQLRNETDSQTVMTLTPKEIVYEGGRTLQLPDAEDNIRYYVYGPYGVYGIFNSPAGAVNLAYNLPGVVVNEKGTCVWLRGNRAAKNQIMAIKEEAVTEEKGALAVCLDAMLANEGITRNSQYLLDRGENVLRILEENMEGAEILDLTGCPLDAVLYYVNRDIPVLALLENGSAVLLVGFNEYNAGMLNPLTGSIDKMGMNDSAKWFEENGNQFITYMKQ